MKIGIIGIGVVGREVLTIIKEQNERLEDLFGEKIEIVKVSNRSPKKDLEKNYRFVEYSEIIEDPEIDTVIELIGGTEISLKIARKTLSNGKNLITANKHLLAVYGEELFTLAKENNVKLFFEAAVGGGIPVLSPLKEGLFPNEIKSIKGILNGTANYILTNMDRGSSFSKALEDATIKGYAEADPTFDIEGIDTGHKISLLAYIAWGNLIKFDDIRIEGISNLSEADIKNAKNNNKKYKLIGSAKKEGNTVKITVKPELIDESELLYNVDGVYNAVEVEGSYTGKTVFYGEGAGGSATASAVISDLYKVIGSKSWNN